MGKKKYCHLATEERHVLSAYLKDGMSLRSIGLKVGRSAGGLCGEIRENSRDGTRQGYEPDFAHMSAQFRKWDANRRNPMKSAEVMRYVLDGLNKEWSPVQISGRIKEDHPKDSRMRISHETVYQFINSDEGKGLGLIVSLRRGKPRRHKKRRDKPIDPKIQCIPNRISIDDRPKAVAVKSRYGDWESDSMIGKLTRGEVLSVQKERKSQVVRLRKVGNKSSDETTKAIIGNLTGFPQSFRRTMTFDNGRENTKHEQLRNALGLDTYFCDPYSSWQKGSVENVIGLIRQYIPKGTRLEEYSDEQIMEIQEKLNNRPRKCLGFKTPNEVLSKHLKKLGVQLPA
jgi:IS30 family transposase